MTTPSYPQGNGKAEAFIRTMNRELLMSGAMNALGWLVVGLYLLLGLGYGYFQFVKPGTA